MTPEERSLLQTFFTDLSQARATTKDAEAEAMINQSLAAIPDAHYLLVQHCVLADQALHQAQAEIENLRGQLARNVNAAPAGFASPPPQQNPWVTPTPPPAPAYQQAGYQQAPYQQPVWGPAAQPAPFLGGGGSGLGGFLRNAGTMAVGVAGGTLLAEGISNLFGGHPGYGGFGGGGMGMGGGFGGPGVENVTINNYGDGGGMDANPGFDQGGGFDDNPGFDQGGGFDGGGFDT
jgi:uncharacterized protein